MKKILDGLKKYHVEGKTIGDFILENKTFEIIDMYSKGQSLKSIALALTGRVSDKTRVGNILKENGVRVSRYKYTHNEDFFKKIDTEEKAYWLGFIYADGHVILDKEYNTGKTVITLSVSDIEHLNKFKVSIESDHNISVYKSSSGFSTNTEYCRITITSRKLAEDLVKLGVYPNKTEVLTFPKADVVPKCFIRHFIRGYMDGDGSIVEPKSKKYQLTFTGTKEFLKSLQKHLGLSHLKINKRHDNDVNNYTLAISGNRQVERLLDYIYLDASVYLGRKYERYLRLKDFNKNTA